MVEFYIKNPVFAFGQKKIGEKVLAEFEYVGDFDKEVQYVNPGCSCTKLIGVDKKKKTIIFELDLDKVGAKEGIQTIVNKGQIIYLDPKVPEYVAGENKLRIVNKDKKRITTTINGTVQ